MANIRHPLLTRSTRTGCMHIESLFSPVYTDNNEQKIILRLKDIKKNAIFIDDDLLDSDSDNERKPGTCCTSYYSYIT